MFSCSDPRGGPQFIRYTSSNVFDSHYSVKRYQLDAVRLRIVSLAVRGTGTAQLLRPAFSAPPTARGAMAGPHPLFERRDVAGENLNVIFPAGKPKKNAVITVQCPISGKPA